MKSLQKVLIATTLTLALSTTSFAGLISGSDKKSVTTTSSPTQTGLISGSLTEYVLWVVSSVL